MTDTPGAQLSALIDDELPAHEAQLLARRLRDDSALRRQLASFALIGESVRGGAVMPAGVAANVLEALDTEELHVPPARDWTHAVRPAGMAAVAASVALLAIVGLRTVTQTAGDRAPGATVASTAAATAPMAQVASVPAEGSPVTLLERNTDQDDATVVPRVEQATLSTPNLYRLMLQHAAVSTGPQGVLPRAFPAPESGEAGPGADVWDEAQ